MKSKVTVLVICMVAAVACCGRQPKAQKAPKAVEMEIPVPPAMMEDGQERAEYVLDHYWDNYKPEVDSVSLEQAFSNWCLLTQYGDRHAAEKSLLKGYDRAPERIGALAAKYLYDPNSPYRDEDFYGALMAHTGNTELARLCLMNAVGTKAADFVFEDARGKRHKLYGISARFTILFFSNPGCQACKGIIEVINADPYAASAIADGTVAVVNVYIDEDLDAWREYLPNYPKTWHTGFDPLMTLRSDNIYHIRAIPSVYLLDENKTVILKDCDIERALGIIDQTLAQ